MKYIEILEYEDMVFRNMDLTAAQYQLESDPSGQTVDLFQRGASL